MATSYNEYLEKKKADKKKIRQMELKKKLSSKNIYNIIEESDIILSNVITVETILEDKKGLLFN